jgi:hypothetical protein
MKSVKGFVEIEALINNTPNAVSMLGEMSSMARTYSKEIEEYVNISIPGYTLVTVSSIDIQGAPVQVNQQVVNTIIEITKAALVYSQNNTRPLNPINFNATILTSFYTRVSNLQFGAFVDNGTMALPEWISFISLEDPDTFVRFWLADSSFTEEFDEATIITVPPITTLDDFFLAPGVIQAEIAAIPLESMINVVNDAKQGDPETYIRSLRFDYVNPNAPTVTFPTYWYVIIYSKYGDNIDAIKDAIIAYVLANSTHSRTEWATILPSLFKRTEFVLLPRWTNYSIPNMAITEGLYSPISDCSASLTFAVGQLAFYPPNHVIDNLSIFPTVYKYLAIDIVGGPDNVNNLFKMSQVFPDYIPAATTSTDFNRMSENTKDWSILLERMLIAAETASQSISVPSDMRKIYRNNQLYVSAVFNNIDYLVAAKSNYG